MHLLSLWYATLLLLAMSLKDVSRMRPVLSKGRTVQCKVTGNRCFVIHCRIYYPVHVYTPITRSKLLAILNLAIRRKIRQIAKLKALQKFPAIQ